MRIGHEDIERNKHTRHQQIGNQVNEETDGRTQQQEIGHGVGNRCHEDGDT